MIGEASFYGLYLPWLMPLALLALQCSQSGRHRSALLLRLALLLLALVACLLGWLEGA